MLLTDVTLALGRDNLPETGVTSGKPGGVLLIAGVFTHFNELLLFRSKSSFITFLQQYMMNNNSQHEGWLSRSPTERASAG